MTLSLPMPKHCLFLAGFALLLLAHGALAEPERQDLSGHVLDRDGKPVKKAQVFLYYDYGEDGLYDRLVATTKSKGHGKFRFKKAVLWEPVKEDEERSKPKYAVVARHPKHGVSFTLVMEGDPLDNVTIPMHRAHTYKIDVKDDDGHAIEGARVFLCGGQYIERIANEMERNRRYLRLEKDIGVSSGVTDTQGHVELLGPHKGTFKIIKDGYAEGYQRGNIILFPSARVAGTVAYEDGKPAAGAIVKFEYSGDRLGWSTATLADEEGRYEFADVPGSGFRYSWMDPKKEEDTQGHGKITVEDAQPDSPYVAKLESFEINPGDDLTKDLTLETGVAFAGKVVDVTTNGPAKNLRLWFLIPTKSRSYETSYVKTDENGEFREYLADGTELRVQYEDSQDGDYLIDQEWLRQNRQPFRGTVGKGMEDLRFEVKLWAVQPLIGVVVNPDGKPVAKAGVHLHSDVPSLKTDEEGAFTLKVAPTDRDFELFAITPDEDLAAFVSLPAGTNETTIELEPTRAYEGQVLNTEGLPAAGLEFHLDLHMNDSNIYRVRKEPKTDAESKFTVKGLCPKATYYAWWSSDQDENRDYDYGNATIDLAGLADGEPIVFEAKQYLNALMGRVVDVHADPVRDAKIEVTSWKLRQQNERDVSITTDDDGEFVVPRLAPGEAVLRVTAEGYKGAQVKAPTDSIDFEVVLRSASEPAVYRVAMVGEDGNPVPKAPVVLRLTYHTKDGAQYETKRTRTNSKGIAEFKIASTEEKRNGRGVIGYDVKGRDVAYQGVVLAEDTEVTLVAREGPEHWTGKVVDQDNEPIQGAKVRVVGMRHGERHEHTAFAFLSEDAGFDFTCETEAGGRFELARFSTKDGLSVKITATGYAKEDGWLDPERDVDADKVFRLSPGATVTGTVVNRDTGEPFAGVHVYAGGMHEQHYACEPAPDGAFELADIKPGTYTVACRAKGEENKKYVCPSLVTVSVAAGGTAEVALEIEEGILVRGKMVDKQTGKLPKGRNHVSARAENMKGAWAEVKEDGSWEIYLPEGVFDIMYYIEAVRREQKSQSITVEKGKTYEDIVIEVDVAQECAL